VLASATPEIVAVLAFVGLLTAGAVAVGVLVWRSLRRRWRILGAHPAVRTASLVWGLVSGIGLRVPAGWDVGRAAHRPRREMWRAVGQAEEAVAEADRAGAPVGELPDLCRRLHAAAQDVDRLLVIGADLPPGASGGLRRQVAEVLAAAGNIRLAAVTAASDASGPRVSELAGDARREVECIAAGLERARTSFPTSAG
jgi:hypothetical protein